MFEQFILYYNAELKNLYKNQNSKDKKAKTKQGFKRGDYVLIGILIMCFIALLRINHLHLSTLCKIIYFVSMVMIIYLILYLLFERSKKRWIRNGDIKRQYERHKEAILRVYNKDFRDKEYKAFLKWVKESSEEKLDEINKMYSKVEKMLSLSTLTAVFMSVVGFVGARIVNIIEHKKTIDSDSIAQIINDMGIIYAIVFVGLVCFAMLVIVWLRRIIKESIEMWKKKTTHLRLVENITFQLIEDTKG